MFDHPGIPDEAGSLAERLGADAILFVAGPAAGHSVDVRPCVCVVDLIAQLDRRFDLAWIDESVHASVAETQRAGIHQAVQHLVPGGRLAFGAGAHSVMVALCEEFELDADSALSTSTMRVLRRTTSVTVHDLLFGARSSITRISAAELARRLAGSEPPVVVDTRTHVDRVRSGVIAGSVHVPRTVLEWHLDPSNGYRHPAITSRDVALVIVCNGGYSSSLAAANLAQIGFTSVADLIGGMHEWCAHGFPTADPDHSHLDM